MSIIAYAYVIYFAYYDLKISVIFKGYYVTLVPAQVGNGMTNVTSNELEKELWNIANYIPVCIISSKNHYFY